MNKNLKKRIITSVLLLLLMTAMFLKNEMLMLILLLGCIFSFIEFSRMIKIINQNKKITQLIYNLVFIFYCPFLTIVLKPPFHVPFYIEPGYMQFPFNRLSSLFWF